MLWHRSRGTFFDKPGAKPGAAGKRLVHLLDPLGKAWFMAKLRFGPEMNFPSSWHGFLPRRRREGAVLVQHICSWKLTKLNITHANVMFDQRSAFGSMDWATLDKPLEQMLHKHDVDFGRQRIFWSATTIEPCDGEIHFRPGQGAFMGDGLAVRLFAHHFKEPVTRWQI